MKQFFYTRKSKLLLFMLLAFFAGGVSPTWADELTVYDGAGSSTYYPVHGNYADTEGSLSEYIIPTSSLTAMKGSSITKMTFYITSVAAEKWTSTFTVYMKEISGDAYESSSAIGDAGATVVYTGELDGTASTMDVNFTTNFDYNGGNLLIGFKVTDAKSIWKSATFKGETQSGYTAFRNKNAATREKFLPKTTFTYSVAAVSGSAFIVKDGSTKLTSAYSYNFGLATAGTTKVFTLSNPGTEATPISVDVTGANGFTATVQDNATSIPAGGEKTLTITMPDATASGSIVVTPTGTGLNAFTFNVSGTKRVDGKIYIDFDENALPATWTLESGWSVNSTNHVATIAGTQAYIRTPEITSTGESMVIQYKGNGTVSWYADYPSYRPVLIVYTSADNSTWDEGQSVSIMDNDLHTATFTIPSTAKYIAIAGKYLDIDYIYGCTEVTKPLMTVTQPAALDFGLYDKDASPAPTKTFTIANTGTATLNGINVTSANAAFTITNAPTLLAAGASQDVTITMATGTTGALSSLITVSATDMTDATFTVTGTVKPAGMAVEDFSDGLPANWTNASWTFANGEATGKSSSAYLTTPKLSFSAGDFIIIKAKRYDSDTSDYLTVQGSSDNGSTWTAYSKKLQNADGLSYPDYGTMVLSDIPTTVNKLRFVGYYVIVDEIHGLTYAPVLTVKKGDDVVTTPAAYSFGEVGTNQTVTYNFNNTGAGTLTITNVESNNAVFTTNWTEAVAASNYDLVITANYNAANAGEQNGAITVTTTEGEFVINLTSTFLAADAPKFAVLIGEAEQTTGADLGFGTITSDATKTFIIKNDGTGALNVTGISLPDANYSIDATAPFEVAAGASKTINVTLAASAKAIKSSKSITISAEGFEDFTFVADANVMPGAETIDFATAIPDTWDNESNGWSIDSGAAKCTGKKNLTSPKLTFTDDDFFIFKVKASDSGSGDYVTLEGSTDNGETWTGFDKKTYSYPTDFGANTGDYSTIIVSGISSSINKIRFNGYYVLLDDITGLTRDANDPVIAVKDAENADVASGTTKDFGWSQTAQSTTYKISNSGTGTLTISNITAPEGFTATTAGDVMTVAAGADPLVLTVTMTNAAIGAKSGTVTLTTDGGNFTIPVKGFVYGDRNLVDFTDAAQYTGWTGVNVTDNVASLSSTAIETTPFAATAGEKLYVEIKGSSSYGSKSFSYSYSRDGGANWSDPSALVASTYSNVPDQVFTITDIADAEAASTVLIRFTGAMLGINRIYGFEALTAPIMTLDKTADYNFGMQTEAAEYVITVTNTGTATLNNLAAALTTGTDYSVAITKPEGESTTTISAGKATVPAGQQAIITVTQLFDANNGLASLSDVLTISGDDVASQEIALSGKTRDGSKWYVDFASGIPSTFVEKGNWTTYSGSAYVPYNSKATPSALTSQTITLAAGEKLQFDTKLYSAGGTLKVRHSLNGGLSWSDYTDFDLTSEWVTKYYDLENVASTVAMIEFLSYYAYVDNIYGGTLNNDTPMIQVKKSSTVVASGATEEFGSILAEATANYTIKNIGGGTLTITSPITTVTGVATAAVDKASLAAGESATLTITMPVEAPYGEKSGAVTVKTSLGDFVINYTATTMNPNTLNVDFSDYTLPTGWYADGWTCEYTQYLSRSNRTSDTNFITQKLNVAGTSDVLKFDAKKYSSTYANSTVLKVSYSTDRVNWTEIGNYASEMTTSWKTFEISGLAAGEYYLKFTGRYANVDNIIGWTKVTGIEHDLYITATNIPTTQQTIGASISLSTTVISLRANEAGVYAKLFIDDEEAGKTAAQDISLNASKTFSLNYTLPAASATLKAKLVGYYNNGDVAFTTEEKDIVVDYELIEFSDVMTPTLSEGTFNVELDRDFVAGWNTICLPFEINVTDIHASAKAFSFDAYDEGTKALTFNKVTTLNAGKPYVIYVPEDITTDLQFNGVAITATEAGSSEHTMTFQGTFVQVFSSTLSGCYGLTASGKIAKASATASMKGFRGYFKNVPAGARVMFNGFDDDETTGIRMITIDNTAAEGTYNLQGQKVEQLKKGRLYIINGKKQVVK